MSEYARKCLDVAVDEEWLQEKWYPRLTRTDNGCLIVAGTKPSPSGYTSVGYRGVGMVVG